MGGQKSKANSDESVDVGELGAAMRDATVAGEQLRIGSGYSLGREAAGGNAEALTHLLGGIESAAEAERRAAMWGLSVAGSTAVAPLMERVALTPPTHENLETLSDLLLALGEAAVGKIVILSRFVALSVSLNQKYHYFSTRLAPRRRCERCDVGSARSDRCLS